MSKYFGTDGFRGEAGITLTADHAYKVGRFLGWYYNALRERNGDTEPARVVIGKDTRRSSYMFEYSLVAGLTASGADAYLLHVTTTPSVAYIARVDDFDCGIMISASHNPYYDNGIVTIGWIFDCTYTAGAAGKLFIHLFEFGKTDLSVISLTTIDIAVLFVGCFVLLLVDVLHEKNLEVRQIIGTKNYWVQVVFWTIVVQMIACFGRVASAGGFMYAPCILYDLDGYYTGLRMLLGHMIETGLSSEERQEGIYFAKDLAEIKAILSR